MYNKIIFFYESILFYLVSIKLSASLDINDHSIFTRLSALTFFLDAKKYRKFQLDLKPTCIVDYPIKEKSVKYCCNNQICQIKIYDLIEDEVGFVLSCWLRISFWRNIFLASDFITEKIINDLVSENNRILSWDYINKQKIRKNKNFWKLI